MKYGLLVVVMMAAVFGQSLSPISMDLGIKPGLNYGFLDPDDGQGNYSGIGFQAGLAARIDLLGTLGIEVCPGYILHRYARTLEVIGVDVTTTYTFHSFSLPAYLLLKASAVPMVSPYVAVGVDLDIPFSGSVKVGSISADIEDLDNEVVGSLVIGADVNLIALKVSPAVSFNYDLTGDDDGTANRSEKIYDLRLSLGLYYKP